MSEIFKQPSQKKKLEKLQPPPVRYEREGTISYDSEEIKKEKKPSILQRLLRKKNV